MFGTDIKHVKFLWNVAVTVKEEGPDELFPFFT